MNRRPLIVHALLWMSAIMAAVLGGLDLRDSPEFQGFIGGMIFVAIISIPYLVPATVLVFLPVVAFLRAAGWCRTRRNALFVGVALSPAAMAVVVISSWILEGAGWSFRTHLVLVFTQHPDRIVGLMAIYAIGGAIVSSAHLKPQTHPGTSSGLRGV